LQFCIRFDCSRFWGYCHVPVTAVGLCAFAYHTRCASTFPRHTLRWFPTHARSCVYARVTVRGWLRLQLPLPLHCTRFWLVTVAVQHTRLHVTVRTPALYTHIHLWFATVYTRFFGCHSSGYVGWLRTPATLHATRSLVYTRLHTHLAAWLRACAVAFRFCTPQDAVTQVVCVTHTFPHSCHVHMVGHVATHTLTRLPCHTRLDYTHTHIPFSFYTPTRLRLRWIALRSLRLTFTQLHTTGCHGLHTLLHGYCPSSLHTPFTFRVTFTDWFLLRLVTAFYYPRSRFARGFFHTHTRLRSHRYGCTHGYGLHTLCTRSAHTFCGSRNPLHHTFTYFALYTPYVGCGFSGYVGLLDFVAGYARSDAHTLHVILRCGYTVGYDVWFPLHGSPLRFLYTRCSGYVLHTRGCHTHTVYIFFTLRLHILVYSCTRWLVPITRWFFFGYAPHFVFGSAVCCLYTVHVYARTVRLYCTHVLHGLFTLVTTFYCHTFVHCCFTTPHTHTYTAWFHTHAVRLGCLYVPRLYVGYVAWFTFLLTHWFTCLTYTHTHTTHFYTHTLPVLVLPHRLVPHNTRLHYTPSGSLYGTFTHTHSSHTHPALPHTHGYTTHLSYTLGSHTVTLWFALPFGLRSRLDTHTHSTCLAHHLVPTVVLVALWLHTYVALVLWLLPLHTRLHHCVVTPAVYAGSPYVARYIPRLGSHPTPSSQFCGSACLYLPGSHTFPRVWFGLVYAFARICLQPHHTLQLRCPSCVGFPAHTRIARRYIGYTGSRTPLVYVLYWLYCGCGYLLHTPRL